MTSVSYQRLLKGLMWVAVAIGAYSRLRGLNIWPLGVDEYFVLQSVGNILKHGLPAFGCGGYYTRGLTLQYLIAPLYASGLSAELSGRLVTVACSFAVLPAVYLLGKRLSGPTVACVGVALLSLSLWEIEFARYARMYVPFQAVFVWYLLALHRVVVDERRSAHGWMWLLSLVGVLTWEGGLFLLVTNFVPGLMARGAYRLRYFAVSVGLLLLGYVYSALNFRFMGAGPAFPSDVPVEVGGAGFIMPRLLATTLPSHPAWLAGALVIMGIAVFTLIRLVRAPGPAQERLVWACCIAFSACNLFGCVVITLVLAMLSRWLDFRRIASRAALVAMVSVVASFVFWLAYAQCTTEWHHFYPGFAPGGDLSKLAVVLFKYPNVFDSMVYQWLSIIPRLTLALGALIATACVWAIWTADDRRSASLRLTLVVCLVLVALVGVVDTKYIRTRYTFFFLPVFYLIALTAVYELFLRPIRSRPKRGLTLGMFLLALVGLTEDFGWTHLVHIDRVAQNYRLNESPQLSEHYYARFDFRTPAEFVNLRLKPTDIVVITRVTIAHYLDRTDYFYRNYRDGEFASISCDAGHRERWTGSRLLYRQKALFHVIDAARGNVWLLVRLPGDEPLISALRARYPIIAEYRGLAGKVAVYKIHKPE
ncbi:MAG: hypothetical protein WBL23_05375 [Salinisphaera sp.]|uniref:ArnT family glycosyltransferase n=1 Tax=Salinisphaera sp. TaxID=1914330 RepID=UPI003C7C4A2B